MKLLMIYADSFGYKTAVKNWELALEIKAPGFSLARVFKNF